MVRSKKPKQVRSKGVIEAKHEKPFSTVAGSDQTNCIFSNAPLVNAPNSNFAYILMLVGDIASCADYGIKT